MEGCLMKNERVLPPAVSHNIQSDSPLYIMGALSATQRGGPVNKASPRCVDGSAALFGGLRRHPFVFHVALSIIAVFFMTVLCHAGDSKFVAANYSDRYHLPSCKIAQKIAPEDLLTFNSPEEAVAKGYVPCKKCNPPAPKGAAAAKSNFTHTSKRKQNDQNT
jgi:hypothetical protein